MGRIYKRHCDYCGKYYEGQGKYFCSLTCRSKARFKDPRNHPRWKGGKITLICKQCGKEFQVNPARRNTAKYCSRECQFESQKGKPTWNKGKEGVYSRETIDKMSNGHLKNPTKYWLGKKHPEIKEWLGEYQFKKGECKGENNPFYGKKHTEESKRKESEAKKGKPSHRKGKTFEEEYGIEKANEIKEKIRKARKQQKLPKHHTKQEVRLMKINDVYNLQLKFVGDGSFWINGLNPDFISNNGIKAVVEIFGRVYHDPNKAFKDLNWKAQEFGRKAIFSQAGYKTLILWDDEMEEKSDEKIAKKINKFYENEF